jgi:hypothetical protein
MKSNYKEKKKDKAVKPLYYDDTEVFIIQCICGNTMDSRTFKKRCTACGQKLKV